jgi:antitoxin (DNA-binding transcriptional repressor) of toxin-antitoxin stability system
MLQPLEIKGNLSEVLKAIKEGKNKVITYVK